MIESGILYGCGENSFCQVGCADGRDDQYRPVKVSIKDSVKSVHAGCCHAIAITNNNKLYVWGLNVSGQLPFNSSDEVEIPHKVKLPDISLDTIDIFVMYQGCWLTTSKYQMTI